LKLTGTVTLTSMSASTMGAWFRCLEGAIQKFLEILSDLSATATSCWNLLAFALSVWGRPEPRDRICRSKGSCLFY
jgi:hypothetical protein